MSIAGPAAADFWSQQQTTLSELLMRAGNQRAARLLSLVPAAELRDGDPRSPVPVVLRVRPTFLDLFRPTDLQAIAEQMNQLRSWDTSTGHLVTVEPMLADPFARADLGSAGTIQAGHRPRPGRCRRRSAGRHRGRHPPRTARSWAPAR